MSEDMIDQIRACVPDIPETQMSRAERDRARLLAALDAVLALATEMEKQPASEIGTIRGIGTIIRADVLAALRGAGDE